jgi:multidrug efflux system outer membrane protein
MFEVHVVSHKPFWLFGFRILYVLSKGKLTLMHRILVLAVAASLAACTVGPDYRRPAVDIPQSFRYEEKEARDAVNDDWWKLFRDPVLDRLILEALANNKDVKIAAANIQQAAGVLMQARSPLFPLLDYKGAGTRRRIADIKDPQTSFSILSLSSWEIDLWGRFRRLTESARAELLSSEEARRGVILSLVASVASSYLQLRGLDEQLAISRRTLDIFAETVALFETQFKYGQVSQMNVAQARSQYETAAAAIPPIESQIARLEHAISILLGRNPGPVPRGHSIFALVLPEIPSGLPSDVLERRPDIRQAEQILISANARIGAARALYFPAVSLTGSLGAASAGLSDLFTGPERIWSYGGSVTGPLFTAGNITGQVQQAEAALQGALMRYEAVIQNAFADVEDALVVRRKTSDLLAAQDRLVRALKQYAYAARLQYEAGYSPYLAVLDAEQRLFQAELNLAQARASLCAAYVALYQATGGGWVVSAEKITEAGSTEPD